MIKINVTNKGHINACVPGYVPKIIDVPVVFTTKNTIRGHCAYFCWYLRHVDMESEKMGMHF